MINENGVHRITFLMKKRTITCIRIIFQYVNIKTRLICREIQRIQLVMIDMTNIAFRECQTKYLPLIFMPEPTR